MRSLFSSIFIFMSISATAQDISTAASKDYQELLNAEKLLISQQDSIQALIDRSRYLLSTEPRSANKINKELMTQEDLLFDVRDKLGVITTNKNMLEKQMALEKINTSTEPQEEVVSSIWASSFFKENISQADLAMVNSFKANEAKIKNLAERQKSIYTQLDREVTALKNSQGKQVGDSLTTISNKLLDKIIAMDDSVRILSEPIFDKKIEIYSILLDKLNSLSSLEQMGQYSRDLRSKEYEASSKYLSPSTAMFPRKEILMLEYEKSLSRLLELNTMEQNITTAIAKIDPAQYDLEYIEVPNWNFVDYKIITIGGSDVHSAKNPIPELDIPSNGDMYKVRMRSYIKPQTNYTIFRRVYPIEQQTADDGEVTYYAGTYKTLEDAEKGLTRIKKLGFSTAEVKHWHNGELVGEVSDDKSEDSSSSDSSEVLYRVEFTTLSEGVKDIISEHASGKELARSVDSKGNGVFILGIFSSKDEAEEISLLIDGANVIEVK